MDKIIHTFLGALAGVMLTAACLALFAGAPAAPADPWKTWCASVGGTGVVGWAGDSPSESCIKRDGSTAGIRERVL